MAGTLFGALWDRFGTTLGSRITGARTRSVGHVHLLQRSIPHCCPTSPGGGPGSHAREEARLAYRAWVEADEPDRAVAFAVYRAAEEREEAAARAFGVS